ncbi:MAG: nucleotide pyrophosphohydrolase [Pseudomonadota bacterium]
MTRKAATLASLRIALRRFAAARDWEQFHTPKNLAAALSVEAAELLEHFQWLTSEQSARLGARRKRAVENEIADVLLYLMRLADVLEIDLLAAAQRKMRGNARKYPIRRAKGNALKYSEHWKGKR